MKRTAHGPAGVPDPSVTGLISSSTPSQPVDRPVAPPPQIPDHELLRRIGGGSYGQVWLARNIMGSYRAVKVVYRHAFEHERPYEREFEGIQKFEPISRTHESQLDVLHVGRNDQAGYFYYVMELADDVGDVSGKVGQQVSESGHSTAASPLTHLPAYSLTPSTYIPHTLKWHLDQHARLPFEECLRLGWP